MSANRFPPGIGPDGPSLPESERPARPDHGGNGSFEEFVAARLGALVWMEAGDGLMISVSVPRSDTDGRVTRRVAASIVPDPGVVAAVSLSFGWLPERFTGPVHRRAERYRRPVAGKPPARRRSGQRGRGGTRLRGVHVEGDADDPARPVRSPLPRPPARRVPRPPPERVEVRIFRAFARADLDGGRLLRVKIGLGYEVSRAELIRIIEEIVIGPAPDTSWLPRR
jgi:hypothetical protein